MILKRLRDITAATINEVLDHVEDPIAMLNQYMRDMEEEISKAELAVARQTALEKKWKQEMEEAGQMAEKRERQAKLAVQAGEEELARKALKEKHYYKQKAAEYLQLYEATKQQAEQLREQLLQMKDKFYEMRNKKYALLARANAAKAQQNISMTMIKFDTERAEKRFKRMEEKVMQLEAAADYMKNARFYLANEKLEQLEKQDEIEKELEILKKSIVSQ